MGDNGLNGAFAQAHALGEPKPLAQIVVTLLDNQTTNLSYGCDEITARGLLDKARSIIDLQSIHRMNEAASKIVRPRP